MEEADIKKIAGTRVAEIISKLLKNKDIIENAEKGEVTVNFSNSNTIVTIKIHV